MVEAAGQVSRRPTDSRGSALPSRRGLISASCRSLEVHLRAYYRSLAAADTPTFGEKAVHPSYPRDPAIAEEFNWLEA
jgi:hypothetical protein